MSLIVHPKRTPTLKSKPHPGGTAQVIISTNSPEHYRLVQVSARLLEGQGKADASYANTFVQKAAAMQMAHAADPKVFQTPVAALRPTTPPTQLESPFEQLTKTAGKLNRATDALSAMVGGLDQKLKKLNLGVEAWVVLEDEAEENFYHTEELGYSKIASRWGISLRCRDGEVGRRDTEEDTEWLFSDAPREMRLKALKKFPNLLNMLNSNAEALAKRIDDTIREVLELAATLDGGAK